MFKKPATTNNELKLNKKVPHLPDEKRQGLMMNNKKNLVLKTTVSDSGVSLKINDTEINFSSLGSEKLSIPASRNFAAWVGLPIAMRLNKNLIVEGGGRPQ